MRKNSLAKTGLSLSQAQSISNLCNQRAKEIFAKLEGVNNYSKSIDVPVGDGNSVKSSTVKTHTIVVGKPLPKDVVALLNEKASLHACQAFLMENIKAKDAALKAAKSETADLGDLEAPDKPKIYNPAINQLPNVDEEWGWSQLTACELNEFIEAEAYAAHIGQFIHQDGILDHLRRELPHVPPIEWFTVQEGVKTPVEVKTHHTSEDLLAIHEQLAKTHREKEQVVNYFKSKVKNLTTSENARIANVNADAQADAENKNNIEQSTYDTAFKAYSERVKSIRAEFEKTRQANIKEIAATRIGVDQRFQPVVDIFLKQLTDTQE
jgi:hypothetical protein